MLNLKELRLQLHSHNAENVVWQVTPDGDEGLES
jgi:hypothetical protein